jgi:hypothetical protein
MAPAGSGISSSPRGGRAPSPRGRAVYFVSVVTVKLSWVALGLGSPLGLLGMLDPDGFEALWDGAFGDDGGDFDGGFDGGGDGGGGDGG